MHVIVKTCMILTAVGKHPKHTLLLLETTANSFGNSFIFAAGYIYKPI